MYKVWKVRKIISNIKYISFTRKKIDFSHLLLLFKNILFGKRSKN